VGIVAGFKPPKALHYFVDVAKKVSDRISGVKFLMVGDGELRPQLEAQIQELQLESVVKMIGWRRDIPDLLQVFDIFLLTSLWEGLPRVLVEAMVIGIPVIAMDIDGIAEVVKNGENGYLVSPGDTDKMAEQVMNLLGNEGLRLQMGYKAKSMVSEFSAQKMLEDYTRLYQNMASPLRDRPS
jgi:glycosyltransferase involved in cell wall biosynthesis